MILVYTYQGGVKTIVWTDTLQTTCMLIGLVACVVFLLGQLNLSVGESLAQMDARGLSRIFTTAVDSPNFYLKQIVAGAFIVHHHDRHGPGDDAEDDLGQDAGRLAEEPAEPDR